MHSFIKKIVLFCLKCLLETEEAHSPKLLPSYKLQLVFSNIVIMGDIFFQFLLTTVTVVLQLEIYSGGGGGGRSLLPCPHYFFFLHQDLGQQGWGCTEIRLWSGSPTCVCWGKIFWGIAVSVRRLHQWEQWGKKETFPHTILFTGLASWHW